MWRSFALNPWMSVIKRPSVSLDGVGITFFALEFIPLMSAQTNSPGIICRFSLNVLILLVGLAPHFQQAGTAVPAEPTELKIMLTWTPQRPLQSKGGPSTPL